MSFFQHNGILKFASLLLACLLWIYVRSEEAAAQREFVVPLEIPVPAGQVLVEPAVPPTVRVTAQGPAGKLEALEREQIRPTVVMEGYEPGQTQMLRVQVPPPAGMPADDLDFITVPAWIKVRTEARLERRLPLVLETEGALPEGWDWVESPRADVEEVQVGGLQSAIERVARVVATVRSLSPEEREQTVAVSLRALDREGNDLSDRVTLDPPQVQVRARLGRTVWSKRVIVQPIFSVPAGSRIRVSVDPRRVTVYGTRGALQELHFIETPEIVVPEGQARTSQEVRLDPAPGISRIDPSSVRVTIEQIVPNR